jgi:hypothetical protein
MPIDPEALQRAMRAQFPAPQLSPAASDWMRAIVEPIGPVRLPARSAMYSRWWKNP